MNFFGKLKARWNVNSVKDVAIILIVFTFTGISSLIVKKPIFHFLGINKIEPQWLNVIVYIFSVLVFYNILLLIFGFLFGKFSFFLDFEKRFFGKIIYIFKRKEK
ncbi:MAG: hypothetical protein HUU47_10375 [Bacteroidetes bacterium]|nr:hypothetical protein [Bacteroidota bacterium]